MLRTLGPKLVLKTMRAPDSSRGKFGKKRKGKVPTVLSMLANRDRERANSVLAENSAPEPEASALGHNLA